VLPVVPLDGLLCIPGMFKSKKFDRSDALFLPPTVTVGNTPTFDEVFDDDNVEPKLIESKLVLLLENLFEDDCNEAVDEGLSSKSSSVSVGVMRHRFSNRGYLWYPSLH
jgi:hypothetical protein